ncbi:hypothetical protein LSH36_131g02023 [Paralvinella palmiformis]|uniref:sn-1-specific diacylglycerol lipase n=1 Tax=Paralvinella palmiformis TaxID=53620 RepID=A0AAD9JXY8_9ANNE|nr:hypothetical protein LSH36_131g02023 [Paralvinella palmiformis]
MEQSTYREVAEAPSINSFKNRLDKYWSDQDIVFNYKAKLNINRKSADTVFMKAWKQWRPSSSQLQKHPYVSLSKLIIVAAVYYRQKAGFSCSYGYLLHAYCIAMVTVLSIHLIFSVAMIVVSSRGTIVNVGPRRHLSLILYCKLFMLLPEFAVTLLGTLWAFDLESNCDKTVVYAMRATALSGWLVLACLIIGIAVVFDPLGHVNHQQHSNIMMENTDGTAQRLWTLRCKVLCCCVNQDEHSTNAFSDIAQLITDFFKGLDIVVSDVAAGLILVQLEQQNKSLRLHVIPLASDLEHRSPIERNHGQFHEASLVSGPIENIADDPVFPSPQTWMTIPQAAHYMRFAAASYGWAMYMYTHLCIGACQLYPACRCCTCVKNSNFTLDDNCCNCNTAAIIKTTGINEQDIVYATYYNRIYQIPFFVALDHTEEAVVISIRGTLSLRDAVTDLSADSEPLEAPGVEDGRAHSGILRAAKHIQQTITELQLLNKAFEKAPGYQLVITGHSLGAGAASILAILLRPDYPQLKCFAFSPPGWLVSLPVSRYTEQFICSVVLGKDLVPRLGLLTMENLKLQIIHTIRKTNKPKYKILLSGVWNFLKILCSTNTAQHPSPSVSTEGTSLMRESPPQTYTEERKENDPEGFPESSEHCTLKVESPLYMPGHVLYIEEKQLPRGCCGVPTYQAAWARVEVFDEIIVNPRMILDHMPDVVSKALNQLSNDTTMPEHYAYNLANETAVI